VWDQEQQAAVQQSFAASSRPFATQAWEQASARLDEYSNRWIAMHNRTCDATQEHGTQSEAMLDLRMACLAAARSLQLP